MFSFIAYSVDLAWHRKSMFRRLLAICVIFLAPGPGSVRGGVLGTGKRGSHDGARPVSSPLARDVFFPRSTRIVTGEKCTKSVIFLFTRAGLVPLVTLPESHDGSVYGKL